MVLDETDKKSFSKVEEKENNIQNFLSEQNWQNQFLQPNILGLNKIPARALKMLN